MADKNDIDRLIEEIGNEASKQLGPSVFSILTNREREKIATLDFTEEEMKQFITELMNLTLTQRRALFEEMDLADIISSEEITWKIAKDRKNISKINAENYHEIHERFEELHHIINCAEKLFIVLKETFEFPVKYLNKRINIFFTMCGLDPKDKKLPYKVWREKVLKGEISAEYIADEMLKIFESNK